MILLLPLSGLICSDAFAQNKTSGAINFWAPMAGAQIVNEVERADASTYILHQPVLRTAEINSAVRFRDYDTPTTLRSESRARNLSLAFTGIPVLAGMVSGGGSFRLISTTTGLILGPSAGLYYAGNRNRAGSGILLRLLGGGVMAAGYNIVFMGAFSGSDSYINAGVGMVVAGGLLVVFSALYDTFNRAPRTVREYNDSKGLSLNPWIGPGADSGGLSLSLRF